MFEYDCPTCGKEMWGGFGNSEVTCKSCNSTFNQKTELINADENEYTAWLIINKE